MEHLKHVRKALQKIKPGSYNYYLEVIRLTNRKTIPVCTYHHGLIQSGKYDGVSLKPFLTTSRNKELAPIKRKPKSL